MLLLSKGLIKKNMIRDQLQLFETEAETENFCDNKKLS